MSNNVGERTRLIHIEQRTQELDAANQPLDAWAFVMRRWGKPLTSSGMAAIRSAEQGIPAGPVRYSWRIMFTPTGIDAGMRVNYKGMLFDIIEVRHDMASREYTDLVCETGANNG